MNTVFRKTALPVILLASAMLFAGCAKQGTPPPAISLDEPAQAQPPTGRAWPPCTTARQAWRHD